MKKVLYIFAAVALLLGVTSCQKDKDEDPEENITTQAAGVYNPEMRISKIYYRHNNDAKKLAETWTWKNNRLIEVQEWTTHYTFSYQSNRLSKIDVDHQNGANHSYYSYIYYYKGANLAKIVDTSASEVNTYEYDYKNGKICSKVETSTFSASYKSTYNYTWSGDNLSACKYNFHTPATDKTTNYVYSYDSKKNPYYGGYMLLFDDMACLSKNNLTKVYSDGKLEAEYSYEYNSKGYPVKKIHTVYNSDGTIAATHTYYYEYLED